MVAKNFTTLFMELNFQWRQIISHSFDYYKNLVRNYRQDFKEWLQNYSNTILKFFVYLKEAASVHTTLSASDEKTKQHQEATNSDEEMQQLKSYIQNGRPNVYKRIPENLKPYWDKKSELHYNEDLIFIGNRLVIPQKMHGEILKKLHAAHQGMHNILPKQGKKINILAKDDKRH